jgi:hypothetical protein
MKKHFLLPPPPFSGGGNLFYFLFTWLPFILSFMKKHFLIPPPPLHFLFLWRKTPALFSQVQWWEPLPLLVPTLDGGNLF